MRGRRRPRNFHRPRRLDFLINSSLRTDFIQLLAESWMKFWRAFEEAERLKRLTARRIVGQEMSRDACNFLTVDYFSLLFPGYWDN